MTYTVSEDNERLDRIAKKLFGAEGNGATDALFEANRRLSGDLRSQTGEIAFGTILRVPEKPAKQPKQSVRPWE